MPGIIVCSLQENLTPFTPNGERFSQSEQTIHLRCDWVMLSEDDDDYDDDDNMCYSYIISCLLHLTRS